MNSNFIRKGQTLLQERLKMNNKRLLKEKEIFHIEMAAQKCIVKHLTPKILNKLTSILTNKI